MEIKAGQIWKRINMDEFFKVVHVSGSDIYLNHLGVRNVSLVTEAVLKDFYTLVCNKGEFIKDKSNMQKTHSTDMVNNPPHYQNASGIECKDITCRKDMSFSLGNAIKYLYRAGDKGDMLEDLKKAKWYIRQAWFNSEVFPEDAVRRLNEVAIHKSKDVSSVLRYIALNELPFAHQDLDKAIAKLEGRK